MRAADIQGLTPAQIKQKLSLPSDQLPTHYSYVTVPANANIRSGIAAGTADGNPYGIGGGFQIDVTGQNYNAWTWGSPIPLS